MNYVDFDNPDGFPLEADATLGFMQANYTAAISGLVKHLGQGALIVSGCLRAGNQVGEGWIWYGGELLYFEAGAYSDNFIVVETAVQKANANGQIFDRYFTKKARFGSGANQYPFNNLQRVESVIDIVNNMTKYHYEESVILQGCGVSSVSTTPQTFAIDAGTVCIDGKYMPFGGYVGAYPIWIDSEAKAVTIQPTTGAFILFDPHTKSRLADVQRRNITPTSEVKMMGVLSDRFDLTGLGKWEHEGFALCNGNNGTFDLRGRLPIGYDPRQVDPLNGIWDNIYNTIGGVGGEKLHVLSIDEMPKHNHTSNFIAPGEFGLMRKSASGEDNTVVSTNSNGSGQQPDLLSSPIPDAERGDDKAHENRPPFLVLAYLQKI